MSPQKFIERETIKVWPYVLEWKHHDVLGCVLWYCVHQHNCFCYTR